MSHQKEYKMLRNLLFLIVIVVAVACSDSPPPTPKPAPMYPVPSVYTEHADSLATMEYDGCEYFIMYGLKKFGITHKGNCSNPIHKCN